MNAPHADTVTRQIAFVRDPISDEDVARANHYALISRLFHAAPDAALLDTLAESADWPVDDRAPAAEAVLMSRAWNALCAASDAMDADAAQTEFDALFGGVGRPLITVFGSFHIAGFVNEKPLARLRDDLADLGLQRVEGESQPEDHVAALADVMRMLLTDTTRDADERAGLQDRFFATHIEPWYASLFDEIESAAPANFYRRAAQYARCFLDIEAAARRMEQ
ncbi:MAG: molecular chaperone TorD family protein [Methyloversatilis sp.]|jgi:TorA maturation chaperone TorD|nr:molecular chaperone TorD family protein [Methyloversatilis sp.]MBP6194700.1 molecular chaperone TorD family protein [Methyloversatilis sp.]MBP9116700.1 molecular chaperone TorD family protein [Methyloversatilis sp.]